MLVAGLNVHDGEVAGWVTDSTRSENFVAFLADLTNKRRSAWSCTAQSTTSRLTSRPAWSAFSDDHYRVFLYNTPTHDSWLNQVELLLLDPRAPAPAPREVA